MRPGPSWPNSNSTRRGSSTDSIGWDEGVLSMATTSRSASAAQAISAWIFNVGYGAGRPEEGLAEMRRVLKNTVQL